ncbi:MAG: 3-deoxy-D-manno-octulosonic acid transferase, partial [Bryobacteraceae bacterium]
MSFRLIRLLYRFLQFFAFPSILLYLAGRGLRDRRYFHAIGERFGRLPRSYRQTAPGAVWLHAVSVGEVLSSSRVIEGLRARFPRVFVSTTTLAGRELAADKLRGVADGVFYAPIDYCFAVRAVLRALRPSVVIVLETEIWPNLWHEASRSGAVLLNANARISDRAWPCYRALGWLFRAVLDDADAILAQTEVSRRRYLELGAPPDRIRVGGNLKYDVQPAPATGPVERMLARLDPPAQVWIAASTMPPAASGDAQEDDAVLDAFAALAPAHPRLLLILAPRRPETFAGAERRIAARGIPYLRRTALGEGDTPALPGVLLLDTIGELSGLFAHAGVVFMGGTLAERGGHNILEPAFAGCAIVLGPHMENFPEVAAEFRAAGAVREIPGPDALAGAVGELLGDEQARRELGDRARELSRAGRGAAEAVLDAAVALRE